MATERTPRPKHLDLALQGGGAHGAFTWGVLDRLLDEDDITIRAVSGTSAGAMNGAALVSGFAKGGRVGAQRALKQLWSSVGQIGVFMAPFQQNPMGFNLDSLPNYGFLDAASRMFAPAQFNPMGYNPLRSVLEDVVDIQAILNCRDIKLYVNATSVRTSQSKVFSNERDGYTDISIESLLASACLPNLFPTVVIDGEAYWDGVYTGNPPLWPLYTTRTGDILLVQINPIHSHDIPDTSTEISNRMNEISGNAVLINEMRAIDFVIRMLEEKRLDSSKYAHLYMHGISLPDDVLHLNASSKLNATPDFIKFLHGHGHRLCSAWLKDHKESIGHRGTLDIRKSFLQQGETS